jgi:chaperone BCS1
MSPMLTMRHPSVVARNNNILKQLVLEAKREYEKDAEHKIHIYMADT